MISNRSITEDIIDEYISRIPLQYALNSNFDYLRTLLYPLVQSSGIEILDNLFDIDNASGKWLDFIGATVGADRQDINITYSGGNYANNDDFYRLYIKFICASNIGNSLAGNIDLLLYNLFGEDIYISNQSYIKNLSIVIFATADYFDFVKILAQNEKLPITAGVSISIAKKPPEGYTYYGFFGVKDYTIDAGKYSLTIANQQRKDLFEHGYFNSGNTIYMSDNDYFKL